MQVSYGRSPQAILDDFTLRLAEVASHLNAIQGLEEPCWSGTLRGHDLDSLMDAPEERLWKLRRYTALVASAESMRTLKYRLSTIRKIEETLSLLCG